MATGVPGVSLRTGSCSTPQSTAMSHPRRQSVSAMVIDSSRNPAKTMVIMTSSELAVGTRPNGSLFVSHQLRSGPPQAARQQHAAELADDLGRNPPRMSQEVARGHVLPQALRGIS